MKSHWGNSLVQIDIEEYEDKLLPIDKTVRKNDKISLGDIILKIIETPGHTNCALAYLINDTIQVIEKCEKLGVKEIVTPHYGWVEAKVLINYWSLAKK